MAFIGEHSGKLDDKGRLILPAELRAQTFSASSSYMIRANLFNASLEIYTMEEWGKLSEKLLSRIDILTEDGNLMWEEFNRDRATITPDEKTGRILIPKFLLEQISIQKEVMFVGQDFRIQIWAKEAWKTKAMSKKELAEKINKIMSQSKN